MVLNYILVGWVPLSFSIDDGDGSKWKTLLLKWICVCKTLSRLLQFAEIVKYGRNFPGFDHLGTALKFRRRKENSIRHRLFTSSIKLEIRHCHVLVVKARQRNVQKSVMHVQRFCFAPQTYFFLTSLLPTPLSLLNSLTFSCMTQVGVLISQHMATWSQSCEGNVYSTW